MRHAWRKKHLLAARSALMLYFCRDDDVFEAEKGDIPETLTNIGASFNILHILGPTINHLQLPYT